MMKKYLVIASLVIVLMVLASGCIGSKTTTQTSGTGTQVTIHPRSRTTISTSVSASTESATSSKTVSFSFEVGKEYTLTSFTKYVSATWTAVQVVTASASNSTIVITIGSPGVWFRETTIVDGESKIMTYSRTDREGNSVFEIINGNNATLVINGATKTTSTDVNWYYDVAIPPGETTLESGWTVVTILVTSGKDVFTYTYSLKGNTLRIIGCDEYAISTVEIVAKR